MVADDDRHRNRFASLGGPLRVVPEMPAAVETGAEAGPPHDLQPVVAGVPHPAIRVLGDHDSVGDVTAAVFGEVVHDRQRAQVEAAAGQHRVQHGSGLENHRVDDPVAEPAPGLDQVRLRDAERLGVTPAVAEQVGDDRERRPADLVEPHHRSAAPGLQLHRHGRYIEIEADGFRNAQDAVRIGLLQVLEKGPEVEYLFVRSHGGLPGRRRLDANDIASARKAQSIARPLSDVDGNAPGQVPERPFVKPERALFVMPEQVRA